MKEQRQHCGPTSAKVRKVSEEGCNNSCTLPSGKIHEFGQLAKIVGLGEEEFPACHLQPHHWSGEITAPTKYGSRSEEVTPFLLPESHVGFQNRT